MATPLQEEKLSLGGTDGKTAPRDRVAFRFLVPPEWVSVLVFMVPVITGSSEDRAAQCWSPLPSVSVALETTVLALTNCSILERGPCTLPGPHNRVGPTLSHQPYGGMGEVKMSSPEPPCHLWQAGDLTLLAGEQVSQFCGVVAWVGKTGPLLPTPCQLQQVGEPASGAREPKSWPCPSPATTIGRAGHVPGLGRTVELALDV